MKLTVSHVMRGSFIFFVVLFYATEGGCQGSSNACLSAAGRAAYSSLRM